ncbi:type IX secretion system membrane protein PorP/SprF [Mucilaginibacter sp. HMF5004]|uniref:PorP/SprF family type IX secretion system membrane protein n=1 Tax=Mucilaginibacter rivuli TaxID=2857527 RepID=UPI001C5E90EE|nr:type IX secretion system membrane protein PorP/SprF [Mucilaginibacter rivuli]MBW4890232.1 type IX secretion system membrane protein PorP/SprF [Mucilaginibacter rivuli]
MKRILILLTFLLGPGLLYAQQDAQQSQYMFNGIYINPAYAGYQEKINLHSYYRNQWTGIPGAPVSMSVALDASANDGNVGLALQLSSDKLGAQSNFSAYANYAYRLRMNVDGTSRLALGLGIGVQQQALNTSLLEPNDPEPKQILGTQSKLIPDARIGVYYSNNKFYAGLSADNLVSQYLDFSDQPYLAKPKLHIYLTGGVLFRLSEDLQLKPSLLLKDDTKGPTSLDINSFVLIGEKLWLGGSFRTGVKLYNKGYAPSDVSQVNSAALAVQVFAMENLRIGYSFDFSTGSLQGYSGGTHEISIGYYFKSAKSRMLTPRYF